MRAPSGAVQKLMRMRSEYDWVRQRFDWEMQRQRFECWEIQIQSLEARLRGIAV